MYTPSGKHRMKKAGNTGHKGTMGTGKGGEMHKGTMGKGGSKKSAKGTMGKC